VVGVNPKTEALKQHIRDVPDFPKPGIVFKDLTTLMLDPQGFKSAMDQLQALVSGRQATKVVGIESRGFVWGGALADRLGVGFAPVRKPGKLPWRKIAVSYALEYGSDTLEIHEDAVSAGERVLVVDDLIATGGTAAATGDLVRRLGGSVAAYVFLVELTFLGGRAKLGDADVLSLIRY
jgi:adenine phosphoribosyltransferase